LSATEKSQFNKVYHYLTDKYFEDDLKEGHETLKNHLCQTYMSFALCDLPDSELERYLGMSRENGLTVTAKNVKVNPNKKTVIKRKKILDVSGAQGEVTYAKKSGNDGILVAENGKVTVKKSVKPGLYPVRIAVTAAGDDFYLEKTVTKAVYITVKKVNPLVVTPKTATVSAGKKTTLKREKVLIVLNAKGKVTYTKKRGNAKISIAKKTGKVTVKKGLKAGKSYSVKVAVKAAGDSTYGPKIVKKVFTIKVKPSWLGTL
jgi:endo-1,4-beta-xylanase